jgi:hypothetical protein
MEGVDVGDVLEAGVTAGHAVPRSRTANQGTFSEHSVNIQ